MAVVVAGLFTLLICCLGPCTGDSDDLRTFHMTNTICVIENLEDHLPDASVLQVIELLRQASDGGNEHEDHIGIPLQETDLRFITQLMTHQVKASVEHGVVLTSDGTTVALAPLVAGIEVGLKMGQEPQKAHLPDHLSTSLEEVHIAVGTVKEPSMKPDIPMSKKRQEWLDKVDHLYAATLAKELSLAYLQFHLNGSPASLGPDGCWDNVSLPQIFTLSGPPSYLTNAFLNGALDGVILGNYVMQEKVSVSKLSLLLKEYYDGQRVRMLMRNRSNFRRQHFLAISDTGRLEEQVKKMLVMHKEKGERTTTQGPAEPTLIPDLSKKAVEAFHQYLECPAIIPRCMWEAKPYRGTPTLLKLPLAFVYIHHTYEPSQPCRTFPECAADMRSMQRFHQEDRGWDDIGYNFVVGAENYLYEGRGWTWQGAHTKGYNAQGYGVSFIGDYTMEPPVGYALALVKDHFLKCVVGAGRLLPGYTIHGHRQMAQTTCPGEALFREIQTWLGFKGERACFTQKQKLLHLLLPSIGVCLLLPTTL